LMTSPIKINGPDESSPRQPPSALAHSAAVGQQAHPAQIVTAVPFISTTTPPTSASPAVCSKTAGLSDTAAPFGPIGAARFP
jgi:hypothetical protein